MIPPTRTACLCARNLQYRGHLARAFPQATCIQVHDLQYRGHLARAFPQATCIQARSSSTPLPVSGAPNP